ncbi:MAG: hypothetical protein ACREIA_01160 [Opitutaceae bacterium]
MTAHYCQKLLAGVCSSAAILNSCVTAADGEEAVERAREIRSADIRDEHVVLIGELGLPLGTIVEIEATVVDGGLTTAWNPLKLHDPISERIFLLAAERVNGELLPEPKRLEFRRLSGQSEWGVKIAPIQAN